MAQAARDNNYITTLIAVSSVDGSTPVLLRADPTTGRLLVSLASFADAETPSGAINGTNKTFTLANTPSPAASLQLFLNGAYQTSGGEDFTLATATITFVNAPLNGSVLRAYYRY